MKTSSKVIFYGLAPILTLAASVGGGYMLGASNERQKHAEFDDKAESYHHFKELSASGLMLMTIGRNDVLQDNISDIRQKHMMLAESALESFASENDLSDPEDILNALIEYGYQYEVENTLISYVTLLSLERFDIDPADYNIDMVQALLDAYAERYPGNESIIDVQEALEAIDFSAELPLEQSTFEDLRF